MYVIFNIAKFL